MTGKKCSFITAMGPVIRGIKNNLFSTRARNFTLEDTTLRCKNSRTYKIKLAFFLKPKKLFSAEILQVA